MKHLIENYHKYKYTNLFYAHQQFRLFQVIIREDSLQTSTS